MHWRCLESGCPLLNCTENCAVTNGICKKLLAWKGINLCNGRYGCPVRISVLEWYGARYVTKKLN